MRAMYSPATAATWLGRLLVTLFACTVAHAEPMDEPVEAFLHADELVFSELECHAREADATVAFSSDKTRLSYPAPVRQLGADGWLRLEVEGRTCWLAPEAVARRIDAEPESGQATRGLKKQDNYATLRVFYATNRQAGGDPEPDKRYQGTRGTLQQGVCEVSIPRDHRLGQLEQASLWRMEFKPDPNQHVVLLSVVPQAPDAFMTEVRKRVAESKSRSLFVFVPGYNVNFADAARRTAQMTYDLGYDGAPIFFSWPSQGRLSGYMQDENNSEWSIPDLSDFLARMARQAGDGEIYLVAHSMGNRIATRALARLLSEQPDLRPRFREVLLIAPDLDADIFKRDLAPVIMQGGTRVTLYASNKDKALLASKKLHGLPRLGEAAPVTILPGMDSIDATEVETDLLGHSYFAEAKHVLSDLFAVIREHRAVSLRAWLKEVVGRDGRYWRFQAH
jgi:esterase/lipase superfamily enzyme